MLFGTALLMVVAAYRSAPPTGTRARRRGGYVPLLVSIVVALLVMVSAAHPRPDTLTIETRPHVAVSPMSHNAAHGQRRTAAFPWPAH